MKKIMRWKISTFVLALLLIISISTHFKSPLAGYSVAQNAIQYINDEILRGRATATLVGVKESGCLYNVSISIDNKEFSMYVSPDGRYIFFNPLDTTQKLPTYQPPEIPKSEKPEVYLFTMSFCPYGNIAEEAMAPVVSLLNKSIEIEPHYVIYSNYAPTGNISQFCMANGTYCSMHGIQELHQDIRELCVYKYQRDKYWDFVVAINKNCKYTNVDSCWEDVASALGLNITSINQCYENEQLDLLSSELSLNKKYNVSASPTLYINGVVYQGSRTPEAYKSVICSAFNNPPEECNQTLSSDGASPSGSCN